MSAERTLFSSAVAIGCRSDLWGGDTVSTRRYDMKKIALFLAMLMVVGSVSGFCLSQAVDKIADNRMKSDLSPVADAGQLIKSVNSEIGKGLDMMPIVKERHHILDPVRKVRIEALEGAKTIVNGMWDVVTMKSMRK
jgi:hypothetical protein